MHVHDGSVHMHTREHTNYDRCGCLHVRALMLSGHGSGGRQTDSNRLIPYGYMVIQGYEPNTLRVGLSVSLRPAGSPDVSHL